MPDENKWCPWHEAPAWKILFSLALEFHISLGIYKEDAMAIKGKLLVHSVLVLFMQYGCTGTSAISHAVRAGDTVGLSIGYRPEAARSNTIVTITDSAGAVTRYLPGDPEIRAVINLFPDPSSAFIIGSTTGQHFNVQANHVATHALFMTSTSSDFSMTTLFVDLPVNMTQGAATIDVEVDGTRKNPNAHTTAQPADDIHVEILGPGGSPATFGIFEQDLTGPASRLHSMERVDGYTVYFSDITGVHSAHIRLTHDPDETIPGGQGMTYVPITNGHMRDIIWTDDGTTLDVMMMASSQSINRYGALRFDDLAFNVAGGITGLQAISVKVFDEDGYEIPGVSVEILPKIQSITPAGPYVGNQQITIYGDNLCSDCTPVSGVEVKVGSDNTGWQPASINSASPDQVIATLPGTLTEGVIWLGKSMAGTRYPVGIDSYPLTLQ